MIIPVTNYHALDVTNPGEYKVMPIMVTNTVQSESNPFRSRVAAGIWAGMTPLIGGLTTKLQIDRS